MEWEPTRARARRGPTTRTTSRGQYTPGERRFSIYWTWSYPWEANRDPTELDNRFSTMTEVRRVAWPGFETPEWDKMNFLQGIAGTLELFHRSTLAFQQLVGEATGHPVAVYQRIDQAGYKLPIDERVLADTDTLMVFGLDHLVSEQEAAPGEIDAIREWLESRRHLPAPGAASRCRLHRRHEAAPDGVQASRRRAGAAPAALRPVHALADERARRARDSISSGSGLPSCRGPIRSRLLPINKDLDKLGLLNGVTTFNFHLHLPHYALTTRR